MTDKRIPLFNEVGKPIGKVESIEEMDGGIIAKAVIDKSFLDKVKEMKHKSDEGVMEMYSSLCVATQEAGGAIIPYENLKTMTVAELLDSLGPNRVRFYCKRKIKPSPLNEEEKAMLDDQ